MIRVQFETKWLQDPRRLIAVMHRANEKAVKRSGAKVRGFMRRMIRTTRKKRSKPGRPPHSHTPSNEFGLKMIVYKYNPREVSMIVGPVLRPPRDVPGRLEKGGLTIVNTKDGKVSATLAARPFAVPALNQYRDKFPEEWRQIIS